ncbi:MAG: bacillithiol system redox-active protein YtxJ [Gemmatimonadetes bacterium]|nr:bacillithiol system redox-active protein YtxJ [Gemmatimonadota bacterium]
MSDRVVRLTKMEELDEAVGSSSDRPVFIYKHSTVCPVSARAADHYHDFAEEDSSSPPPLFTQVLVIENRDLSNEIESRLEVRHESPQLLLLRDGKVAWHASHFSISGENIRSALEG